MSDDKLFADAWLAFDIGCIECGESSAVIGIYKTLTDAAANLKDAEEKQKNDWHGQHHFEAFDVSREVSVFARKAAAKALREAANDADRYAEDTMEHLGHQEGLLADAIRLRVVKWLLSRAAALERGAT